MPLNTELTNSYGSVYVGLDASERFSNNFETYSEGTRWLGILFAFLSSVCFSVSATLVKDIRDVDPMILLSIRGAVQIVVMILVALKNSLNLVGPKDYKLLIQLQGFLAGMMLSLLYYSFRKLPIGDATTIVFSSPAIVIVLSFVFLSEPCGVLRIMVICLLTTGVVLVARPPFLFEMSKSPPQYDAVGYVCAFLTTLFSAVNIVVLRKCSKIHYSVMIFNSSVWSIVAAALFFSLVPVDANHIGSELSALGRWSAWGMIMATAVAGLLGQILMVTALAIESAGKVSVARSFDIVLTYAIQIYFFKEIPTVSCAVGALFILFSVVCMGFERNIYSVCDFIP
ncbi:solute carrier family 35 member G1-like [Copidosoma floridanum]|uniref:solute carrier family 35 member G1-like n=1 Tax=Copidosoma floridanum TaxID=29053 RepID=UPI0006C9ACD0|nr:solute carrier family 35 member G1-like [Copidosoma floridanum]